MANCVLTVSANRGEMSQPDLLVPLAMVVKVISVIASSRDDRHLGDARHDGFLPCGREFEVLLLQELPASSARSTLPIPSRNSSSGAIRLATRYPAPGKSKKCPGWMSTAPAPAARWPYPHRCASPACAARRTIPHRAPSRVVIFASASCASSSRRLRPMRSRNCR